MCNCVKDTQTRTANGKKETHAEGCRESCENDAHPDDTARDVDHELLQAVKADAALLVQTLVMEGADPHAVTTPGSLSYVMVAAELGNLNVVRYLCEGCYLDVDAEDLLGRTALEIAAASDRLSVIRYLVSQGADVEHKSGKGSTPLHAAARSGHVGAVRCLVEECGASPFQAVFTSGSSLGPQQEEILQYLDRAQGAHRSTPPEQNKIAQEVFESTPQKETIIPSSASSSSSRSSMSAEGTGSTERSCLQSTQKPLPSPPKSPTLGARSSSSKPQVDNAAVLRAFAAVALMTTPARAGSRSSFQMPITTTRQSSFQMPMPANTPARRSTLTSRTDGKSKAAAEAFMTIATAATMALDSVVVSPK